MPEWFNGCDEITWVKAHIGSNPVQRVIKNTIQYISELL